MSRNVIRLFILLVLLLATGYGQSVATKSPYLSIHTGVFISSIDNFDKTYDSQMGLVYGLGLGLPVSTRSYIFGKATLFSKSGIPVFQNYSFENGSFVLTSEKREGKAKFTQWIFNGGFLYNFFLSSDWTLGLNGGIAYTKVSEEQKNNDGSAGFTLNGSGVLGFFVGGSIEKNFGTSPFSMFFEPQFNFTRREILTYVANYGGFNMNVGVRYYFKTRRLE